MRHDPTDSRQTQRARILRLLIDARYDWVPLPEILALGIGRYGARLLELKRAGFRIQNRMETVDGQKQSWYRLLPGPTASIAPQPQPAPKSATLFPLERQHRDDG